MMTKARSRLNLPATDLAPKPGDFPIGSMESRVAARVLSNMKEETEAVSVHVEIVGFGDSPSCKCEPCRDRRSQSTPEQQAAILVEYEAFMATACPNDALRHVNAGSMHS
jgi:hypothetical protein